MSLWVHVLGSVTTIDQRGVMHAAPDGAQMDRLDKRGRMRHTWPTVCGRQRTRVAGQRVREPEGGEGAFTLLWPPGLRDLDEGQTRCAECFVLTGKPRPSDSWKASRERGAAAEMRGAFVSAKRSA